jgi:hypothetical protein
MAPALQLEDLMTHMEEKANSASEIEIAHNNQI